MVPHRETGVLCPWEQKVGTECLWPPASPSFTPPSLPLPGLPKTQVEYRPPTLLRSLQKFPGGESSPTPLQGTPVFTVWLQSSFPGPSLLFVLLCPSPSSSCPPLSLHSLPPPTLKSLPHHAGGCNKSTEDRVPAAPFTTAKTWKQPVSLP